MTTAQALASLADSIARLEARMDAELASKPAKRETAKRVSKPKASKAKSTRKKAAKPAKPAKTFDKPFEVKLVFTKTGGLVSHGGARVLYRPEGNVEEQLAWLEHNGLDAPLYIGLVKSEAHKTTWLTYAESKAK